MKTLIALLILASFIQSTIVPLDLVLIILICRSYLVADKNNLILAFGFGLLDSHFNLTPMGFQSLIYLILVTITQSLSKTRLTGNPLMLFPLTLILVSINQIGLSLAAGQSLHLFPKNLLEACIALPVFFLVRLWEERFIVSRGIKLKM